MMSLARSMNRLAPMFCAVALLLAACGDPHDQALPKDLTNWKDDMKSTLDKLSPSERETFDAYAKRFNSGTAGRIPDGTTVRMALADQREYVAAQARKEAAALAAKEKLTQERDLWRSQFENALTVNLAGKKLEKAGFAGDFLTAVLAIKNTGSKGIVEFKGRVEFFNEHGGEITHEDIDYKTPIPPGNAFNHEVRMYRMPEGIYKDPATGSDKMRFHYKPTLIVFANGDKLVLPKEFE
jgi:hypothetical protein